MEGRTLVDAGGPLLRPGEARPQPPVEALIAIMPAGGDSVAAQTTTDAEGRFRVALPPGSYVLHARNTTGAPVPTVMPVHLQVRPGLWTQLTVRFDSGMRGPAAP